MVFLLETFSFRETSFREYFSSEDYGEARELYRIQLNILYN